MLSCILYRGASTPGVSENTIWYSGVLTIPIMRWRVVCALEVMMLMRSPTRLFMSVDLPTLGLPTMFTKPDLWGTAAGRFGSSAAVIVFSSILCQLSFGDITPARAGKLTGPRVCAARQQELSEGLIPGLISQRSHTRYIAPQVKPAPNAVRMSLSPLWRRSLYSSRHSGMEAAEVLP